MKRAALVIVAAFACRGDREIASSSAVARDAKVTRGDIGERVLLTGELRPGTAIDLVVPMTDAWQLTIRWLAEDGAILKAGDRVIEFDNSQFTTGLEQKRIAAVEAEAAFRSARDIAGLALAVKEHELHQHEIALEKSKLLASVPADLVAQRTAQERQLDKARADVAVAKAQRELATEKQANTLESKVKQIELDKAKRAIDTANKTIAELVMKAPRDGVMLIYDHPWQGHRFHVGDMVQPGMKVVTFPDFTHPMQVKAELSDVDDGRIAVGAKGTCTLDAYPKEPLPCEVIELAPVATNRNRQSLRRAFGATLALANADAAQDGRMRPGMSVRVELTGPVVTKNVLVVPRGAIVFGAEGKHRVRMANGDLRDVTLGACDAQRCAVDKGLADGESVRLGGS